MFVVLLRFAADKSQAPDHMADHQEWIRQGVEDGVFPVVDDRRLFEKISLEGFQSGLGWRTILARRENFRKAFAGFDFHLVAEFTEADVDRLLQDPGIVRHRGKIEAVVDNARRAVDLAAEEGSLAAFFWRSEPGPDEVDPPQTVSTSPAEPGRCDGALQTLTR
ncbi:DNA-3-methyladenine glycosylase I [Streptomyces nymphaeiformis]|uniref:DNA-3-methyladenine glycosylase I n=1 Tax=Streptomyces nymphaeiformis TaxID=2663842 RepID=A0A7W7TWT8_9ACTN|nr:DNA-3-methyladenine glycosylase I [Streptomyces nymphaeiformis]MBB4980738.1 DNA-3-methyladenine glycosylase I [Streptomyces nymphaeiformis]